MRITDAEDALRTEALTVLEGARAARSDVSGSEVAVLRALQLAPHDLDVRTGAYKFYFYNSRLGEAAPHAQFVVEQAARRLNVSTDWRLVQPGDAAFGSLDPAPRLFVQALVAWGYCMARLRRMDEGRSALIKAIELDPSDNFGARGLLNVISGGESDDE